MSDLNRPEYLTGIGIPWSRISADTIVDADSTYTESGPRPGLVSSTSQLRIDASGTPTGEANLSVIAVTAGAAGRAGARFTARRIGDTNAYGWDLPIGQRERYVQRAVSGTALPTGSLSALGLADGTLLVAESEVTAATVNTIRVHRRPWNGAWASPAIAALGPSIGSRVACPALLQLSSGRVLCFFAVYESATSRMQVRSVYSDNGGASWSVHADYSLETALDASGGNYTLERLAVAESAGEVCLVMGLDDGGDKVIGQWASADQGCSFEEVYIGAPGLGVGFLGAQRPDVAGAPGSGFVIALTATATATGGGSTIDASAVAIGSAFTSVNDGENVSFSSIFAGAVDDPKWSSICTAEDGTMWRHVVVYDPGATGAVGACALSTDGGITWERIGATGLFYSAPHDSEFPWYFGTTWLRGAVYMAHHYRGRLGGKEGGATVATMQLGGYTQITLPAAESFVSKANGIGYAETWWATGDPLSQGYSEVKDGAATGALTDGGWTTTVTSGTFYEYTDGQGGADDVLFHVALNRVNGHVCARAVATDGVDSYRITLTWQSSTVAVLTDFSGATIASYPNSEVLAWDAAGGVEILMAVNAGKATVATRPRGSGEASWYFRINGATIPGTTGTANFVRWGWPGGSVVGNPSFTAFEAAFVNGAAMASSLADGIGTLRGFPLSGLPRYVLDGLYLSAVGGPAAVSDAFTAPIAYDYPISAIHTETALDGWRSDGMIDPSPVVVWEVDTVSDGPLVADSMAYIYIDGANFRSFTVEYTDGIGSSYVTLADVDLGVAFAFQRTGHEIRPSAAGSIVAGPYVERDELVGSQVQLPDGTVEIIESNTGGYLTSGASSGVQRATIVLARGTISDASSPSGTATIWPRRAVVYVPGASQPTGKVRLTINPGGVDPDPATGDYRLSIFELGRIMAFGRAYSQGRRVAYRSNVRVTELPSGATRARRLGGVRRSINLRWDEGLLTCGARGDQQSVGVYAQASGGQPVASARGTAFDVLGLPDAGDVVSYHPSIPIGTSVVVQGIQRARGVIRIRLGDRTWEAIGEGREEHSEMIRIGLTGEEVL